jgi:hypothetical protein
MPDTIELTHDDIDQAVGEMAALAGVPITDMWNAVREQTGGERDIDSLARGVQAVADALEDYGVSLAPEPESTEAYLSVSQAERDQAHEAGNSLPDKSYPINNAKQLRSAAILAASHHGNWQAARRLIRRRAKELGVSLESLPGFGSGSDSDNDEDSDNVAASYSGGIYDPSMVGSYIDRYGPESFYRQTGTGPVPPALPAGTVALTNVRDDGVLFDQTSPVDSYVLQLATDSAAASQMFGLAREDNYPDQPSAAGTGGPEDIIARNLHILGSRPRDGRGHAAAGCHDPDCTIDHDQPRHGNVVHPEVQRYLDMAAAKMGNREKPGEQSHSYRPLSLAQRQRARRAARPGHTSGRRH